MTLKFDMDIKDIAILAVLVALFILIIFAIKLVKKIMRTLDNVDEVLNDTKRISVIAADRTEQVDEQVDYAIEKIADFTLKLKDNKSIINKAGVVGTAAGAVKSYRKKKRYRANKYNSSTCKTKRPRRIIRKRG